MRNEPNTQTHQLLEGGYVLVVDDHPQARQSMADILAAAGHDVRCAGSAVEGLNMLEQWPADVILSDLKMPGMNGLEFIRELARRDTDAQIVMVTAHATVASAVDAMRFGAFDYIEKPFDVDQLEQLVKRALDHGETQRQRSHVPAVLPSHSVAMIGSGAAMQKLRRRIAQVAPTDETVLVTGESGTGKELVARTIHALSRRATSALVSLNCPALSPQLMESELFGHERGAFTGADTPRVGRFELADGGTIMLDEITEIDVPLQAKLLRVLQERTFERVGANLAVHVDVRVLATTNRDLRAEVDANRFREDLYFRLAVLPIHVPPLRERREDIPELAEYFLHAAAQRLEREAGVLTDGAIQLLTQYDWPGNVRELENIITRASVLGDGTVTAEQLRPWLPRAARRTDENRQDIELRPGIQAGMSLQAMERKLIEATLEHFHGHRARTAKALGIGVRTLANKLRSYGYGPRERSFSRAA